MTKFELNMNSTEHDKEDITMELHDLTRELSIKYGGIESAEVKVDGEVISGFTTDVCYS